MFHIIDPPRKKVPAPIVNLKVWCTLSLSNNFIFKGMEIVAEIATIPTIDPRPKSNTNPKPCKIESTVPKAKILRAADPKYHVQCREHASVHGNVRYHHACVYENGFCFLLRAEQDFHLILPTSIPPGTQACRQ